MYLLGNFVFAVFELPPRLNLLLIGRPDFPIALRFNGITPFVQGPVNFKNCDRRCEKHNQGGIAAYLGLEYLLDWVKFNVICRLSLNFKVIRYTKASGLLFMYKMSK